MKPNQTEQKKTFEKKEIFPPWIYTDKDITHKDISMLHANLINHNFDSQSNTVIVVVVGSIFV